jgi:hypothetical protein
MTNRGREPTPGYPPDVGTPFNYKECDMKFIEILQGRVNNEDKYTIHIHNPFWFILGAIPGYWLGRGVQIAWNHVTNMLSQGGM